MVRRAQEKSKVVRLHSPIDDEPANLPYFIELWDDQPPAVERVLARAVSAELARAIFKAARVEHPDRRITLRRGKRMISDTRG